MWRYLETYFRHPVLFMVPVLAALVLGPLVLVAQPQRYQATARMWFDSKTGIIRGSDPSADNPYLTVSDQQQQVFTELIRSRSFAVQVAHRGPLAAHLATPEGYTDARGTGAVVQAQLSRLVGQRTPSPTPDEVNDLAYQVLSSGVVVTAAGPQIVALSFTAGRQDVAQGTLQAVLDSYSDQILRDRHDQAQSAVAFYQDQSDRHLDQLHQSQQAVATYLQGHPAEAAIGGIPSGTLLGLKNAQDVQQQRYTSLLDKLDQAKLQLAASVIPSASGFRIIDPARVANTALSKSRILITILGGLLAGLLVSVVITIITTLGSRTLRGTQDVERALGLQALGHIPGGATGWRT